MEPPAVLGRLLAHPQWPWLALDVAITGAIIAAGVGIVIGAWATAVRLRGPLPRGQVALGIGLALALGVGWFIASANAVTQINQNAPDTATAYHQLLQPATVLPLLPGIIGLALTQWFQQIFDLTVVAIPNPVGIGVVALILLAAVGLPAALLAMGILPLLRVIAWRTHAPTPRPATEDIP